MGDTSVDVERLVSINTIIPTIIEPTFATSTSESATTKLRAQLDAAIATIPHCIALIPVGMRCYCWNYKFIGLFGPDPSDGILRWLW